MFSRIAAIHAHRCISAARIPGNAIQKGRNAILQKRTMAGGGGYLQISQTHTNLGEAMGVVLWLWVFYRARQDLPVVYGFRHPWEHGDDHGDDHHHHSKPDPHAIAEKWDKFSAKATKLSEDDDDDDEEEEE